MRPATQARMPADVRATRRSAAGALCAAVAGIVVAGVPAAHADPLGDARARAAALAHSLEALQTKAEIATERWDKANAELLQANADQAQADQALNAIQAKAAAAPQAVTAR